MPVIRRNNSSVRRSRVNATKQLKQLQDGQVDEDDPQKDKDWVEDFTQEDDDQEVAYD